MDHCVISQYVLPSIHKLQIIVSYCNHTLFVLHFLLQIFFFLLYLPINDTKLFIWYLYEVIYFICHLTDNNTHFGLEQRETFFSNETFNWGITHEGENCHLVFSPLLPPGSGHWSSAGPSACLYHRTTWSLRRWGNPDAIPQDSASEKPVKAEKEKAYGRSRRLNVFFGNFVLMQYLYK